MDASERRPLEPRIGVVLDMQVRKLTRSSREDLETQVDDLRRRLGRG